MSPEEFSAWMERWRRMLAPDGCIVLSDIIPRDYSSFLEPAAMLGFSARHGYLLDALWGGLKEIKHYAGMRRSRPLARIDREDLRAMADALRLKVRFLPRNLTYRKRRTTAVFTNGTHPTPSAPEI